MAVKKTITGSKPIGCHSKPAAKSQAPPIAMKTSPNPMVVAGRFSKKPPARFLKKRKSVPQTAAKTVQQNHGTTSHAPISGFLCTDGTNKIATAAGNWIFLKKRETGEPPSAFSARSKAIGLQTSAAKARIKNGHSPAKKLGFIKTKAASQTTNPINVKSQLLT